jgi:hypothetical protein
MDIHSVRKIGVAGQPEQRGCQPVVAIFPAPAMRDKESDVSGSRKLAVVVGSHERPRPKSKIFQYQCMLA